MVGWINWEMRGMPRVRHRVILLEGVPVCRIELRGRSSGFLLLHLYREKKRLQQAGIREAIFPDSLPPALRMEMRPINVSALRRAFFPALLEQAYRQKRLTSEHASVCLTAEGTSLAVYWAAQLLAQKARYLHIRVGMGEEALKEWLRQRFGVACGGSAPVLEVSLKVGDPSSALLLGEDCARQQVDYILPSALQEYAPSAREGEQLLAVLYRAGKLRAEELFVERIHFNA